MIDAQYLANCPFHICGVIKHNKAFKSEQFISYDLTCNDYHLPLIHNKYNFVHF